MTAQWRSGQLLAWTERDGPGRPPAGPSRTLAVTVAASLGVVFAAVLSTDALCPEHRAWIDGLATFALLGAGFAIVGLVRGWVLAPALTLLTALCGVAMGVIDASHDATRGSALAVAFGAVAVLTAGLGWRQQVLRRWDRHIQSALIGANVPEASSPLSQGTERQADSAARPVAGADRPVVDSAGPLEPRLPAASDLRARR